MPIRIVPFHQIQRSTDQRYLIDQLIPARDITVVWGKPKSGKTFWVLDLALHISIGRTYRGKAVDGGPVVYCAFEGAHAFPDRLHAARDPLGLNNGRMPEFYLSPDRFSFTKVGGADGLVEAIKRELPKAPVLVVLDTLNRSLDGSENSDEDMTHYTRCAEDIGKEFKCAVLIVHHCGISGDKPRGHTSLTGTCAAQIKVSRMSRIAADPTGPSMMSATVEFMKDGPEGQQIFSWIRPVIVGKDDRGRDITSCYLEDAPAPADGDDFSVLTGQTKKALAILQELIADSEDSRATQTQWKGMCVVSKLGKTKAGSEKAFYRAIEVLKDKDVVRQDGQWIYLVKQAENVVQFPGGPT